VLQSQKTIPAAKTSQSSFHNKSGEEKTTSLDKIESQLSLVGDSIQHFFQRFLAFGCHQGGEIKNEKMPSVFDLFLPEYKYQKINNNMNQI
jgi:hypothetical protein